MGAPLAYQVQEWEPVSGPAGIWVRVPVVRGDEDQEIRVHRGRADAVSGSDGPAVFNASNGYLGVWHVEGVVKDEVGTLESMAVARRAKVARPPDLPGNPCPSREPRRLSRHGRPAGTGPCQPFVASPDLARRWF